MVRKFLLLSVVFAVLLSFTNCKKRNHDIFYDRKYIKEIKAARKDAIFYMSRNTIPGATFAISKDGKIIYSEGLGLASKDLNALVTRKTKFRIGQLSELFTNIIYQKLVEDGTLHPDSTIQHYYPDFPEKEFRMNVKDLVYHTSGIRMPKGEETDWRGLNVSLEAGLENFKNDSLEYPPGYYMVPNHFNYDLLGMVMEKATGTSFLSLMKTYVTDTLGLENTTPDNFFGTVEGRTQFYDHNFISVVVNATTRDLRYKMPSEGMLSNAEDLVKFGNAILYSDYLEEKTKSKLFEPITLPGNMPSQMVNGWILLEDNQGRKIYGRSGSITGGNAALIIYPEEKMVVAAATNLTSMSDDLPVFVMANHFFPEEKADEAAPLPAEEESSEETGSDAGN
ncbi:MAG: beta-lactamase family protein [Porphyromonadaceae bacterium]|nr:beta-lactamase family protein [Porphyromonadaceae bacterium]